MEVTNEHAPYNPLNGHPFKCGCEACLIFWDGKLGLQVYEHWRIRRREVQSNGERNQVRA